jgi:hypothetical protein
MARMGQTYCGVRMLTPRQFATFTPKRRAEMRPAYIYIAQNPYGIRSGYYRDQDITRLLRDHRGKGKVILYIARQVAG